jgi:hypothetical protein
MQKWQIFFYIIDEWVNRSRNSGTLFFRTLILRSIPYAYPYHTFPIPFLYLSYTFPILSLYSPHTLLILSSYSPHTLLILSSYSLHTLFIHNSYTLHTFFIQNSYRGHTWLKVEILLKLTFPDLNGITDKCSLIITKIHFQKFNLNKRKIIFRFV